MKEKSQFSNQFIRKLYSNEKIYLKNLSKLLTGKSELETIGMVPAFASKDNCARPLVISNKIVEKTHSLHGTFQPENFIVNACDWDYLLKNVDKDPDRINLIKLLSGNDRFLNIGANRDNGFFIVTHYEVTIEAGNELKSLLGRGDVLDINGVPSGAP